MKREGRVCCTVRKADNERVAVDDAGGVASSTAVDAVVSRWSRVQSQTTSLHLHRLARRQPASHALSATTGNRTINPQHNPLGQTSSHSRIMTPLYTRIRFIKTHLYSLERIKVLIRPHCFWSTRQGDEMINFGGQKVKGQRSRSHDVEVRFGGLAEASFSTSLVE